MTLKEKLQKEHPELDIDRETEEKCPCDFNLMDDPEKDETGMCAISCEDCWARKVEAEDTSNCDTPSVSEVDSSLGEGANAPVIRMIEVDKIHPHPDNPRKDLGDLSELVDSIKEQGIMQNLTVVPGSYGYTVVIGHRRLAAAKMAGLKEVPCVVRAMSEKEQLAVMLSENMQRNDLTIVEQAGGIQMMLDLGDTVSDVSRQTGLSESTVRRRKNLMKIASVDKLKEAEMKGATLADYEKLLEIKDEAKREKVLESIGTNNFAWELRRAIDAEKDAEKIKILKQYMDAQATEIGADEVAEDMRQVTSLYTWQSQEDFSKPLEGDGRELFYYYNGSNTFTVYRRLTEEEIEEKNLEELEEEREETKIRERRDKLQELWGGMKQMRSDFFAGYEFKQEHLAVIAPILLTDEPTYRSMWCDVKSVLGDRIQDVSDERAVEIYNGEMVLNLLAVKAYVKLKRNASSAYNYYDAEYEKNEGMEKVYAFLVKLGYVMSDEEKALLDGSHEVYKN
ncbi:MAG: ParB/RepB/Spo0J family partition protein [Clostridia bacterium]|nr:ParB/RepB/Spo0J family partition protein [Clostridia bacterium]